MEKKVYILEKLGCANCAAKMETKLNAHPEVQEASIVFATRQLRLTAEDPDALIPQLQELIRTVEADVTIVPREARPAPEERTEDYREQEHGCCEHGEHHGHHECGCGHHHGEQHGHHECGCGHHHGEQHEHHECGCGHHHGENHEGHGCACGHSHGEKEPEQSKLPLMIGGGLLVLGLILEHMKLEWLSLAVNLVAYGILGKDVILTAVRNLKNGNVFDENFLMSLATVGAFLIGEYSEAVGVMLFYRVGEYFEHKAVQRSRSQIMEAVDLRPEVVQHLEGETVREIPAAQAKVGDLLLVRPGDRIPLDGIVVKGSSRVDTAPITGEPVPVAVKEGDTVISGCVNTAGQLILRVEKPLEESMVTRILDSVENAAASKPKMERFLTRFSRIYTPAVVAVAAITAIVPPLVTGDWGYWVYTALTFLVMSCPCALVLSVPLAYFAGIGAGSRKGILFKGGQSMEAMAKIKAVVMDKTGTLTKGDFKVQSVVGPDGILEICASCEQRSTHPIAVSIVQAAKERNITLRQPEELEELAGLGIRAVLEGKEILCGNGALMDSRGIQVPKVGGYGTKVLVAENGVLLGHIVIADTVKSGAEPAVRQLKEQGIHAAMLTGDEENAAKAVAGLVGIREVHAGLLPQQKLEHLQAIRQQSGAVMFVGDGINDAPVLAGADVGAAMGSGADAAIEAADVVFMTSDVEAVPQALRIAKQTGQIAWQNVVFALGVKVAVMILGLCGYAFMWLAVFADSGVAMLCVLNAVRMLYKK